MSENKVNASHSTCARLEAIRFENTLEINKKQQGHERGRGKMDAKNFSISLGANKIMQFGQNCDSKRQKQSSKDKDCEVVIEKNHRYVEGNKTSSMKKRH